MRPRAREFSAWAFANTESEQKFCPEATPVGAQKCTIKMYKFGQIPISSKEFNSVYRVAKNVDLEKIRVSEGVAVNSRCDTRFIIGYETEPGVIVPLYIKTPKDCFSSGVSRYNESSPWKMSFNLREDEAWMHQYAVIWETIEELLGEKLMGNPLCDFWLNAKLITWGGEIRTRFIRNNSLVRLEGIGSCKATGVLKIGSVYRQGSNCNLQVFLKECKYKERDTSFESQLSDDDESDDSGYDTIH